MPFFRFPGFADTPQLDQWLKSRNIGIFGTDLWASDWLDMTPNEELQTVLTRLDKEGRGILLLHDSRRSTALMLPKLLVALKQRGYRIVHLVPGAGPPPKFREAPKGWRSETEEILAKVIPHLKSGKAPQRASDGIRRNAGAGTLRIMRFACGKAAFASYRDKTPIAVICSPPGGAYPPPGQIAVRIRWTVTQASRLCRAFPPNAIFSRY